MRHGDFYIFPEDGSMPASVELAGTDFCHDNYLIRRKKSNITVMACVVSGSGTVQVGSLEFHPKKGDVFILPKGSDHEYYVCREDPWVLLWFNIKGGLIPSILSSYQLNNIFMVEDCDVEELFAEGIALAASDEDKYSIQKKIIPVIIRIILEIAAVVKGRNMMLSWDALKIKNYLDNHVEESVTLGELSSYTNMSARQINRIFKKELGNTPYNYLLEKKMEMAKSFLINTNLTVKQIAHRLSFDDPYYFSNIFKQKTGLSPVSYKRTKLTGP